MPRRHRVVPSAELESLSRIATIRELHLHSGPSDDDLATVSRMGGLEDLCLFNTRLRGHGLRHLASLRALGTLTLGRPESDEWRLPADALRHFEALPALRSLHLGSHGYGREALARLARLGRLEYLGFDTNPIRDEHLAHLSGLVELRRVGLADTEITGAGLVHLEPLSGLVALESLDLGGNHRIVGPGLAHLAKLPRLETLDLSNTGITDAAVPHLTAMKSLERLTCYNCDISEKGMGRLRKAFPRADR